MPLADRFSSIVACAESHRPDAAMLETLAQTAAACADAASAEQSPEAKQLLINLQTAVTTWQQVWPRLGAQREFRLAVAREAKLWSKRLSETVRTAS